MFVYGPPWGDTAEKRNEKLDLKVVEALAEVVKQSRLVVNRAEELLAQVKDPAYYGETAELDATLKYGRASFIGRGVSEVQRPLRDLLEASLEAGMYASSYEVTEGE